MTAGGMPLGAGLWLVPLGVAWALWAANLARWALLWWATRDMKPIDVMAVALGWANIDHRPDMDTDDGAEWTQRMGRNLALVDVLFRTTGPASATGAMPALARAFIDTHIERHAWMTFAHAPVLLFLSAWWARAYWGTP